MTLFPLVTAMLLQIAGEPAWANDDKWSFNFVDENEIATIVHAQLKAFRKKQFDLAFEYASDNIKDRFRGPTKFMAIAKKGYGVLLNPLSVRFDGLDQRLDFPVYKLPLIANDGRP